MSRINHNHIIGSKLRFHRIANGFTQQEIGERVGVTFQQVQKYERGANNISASMLYELAKVLNVPVTEFYRGIEEAEFAPDEVTSMTPVSAQMLKYYSQIQDSHVQNTLLNLVKELKKNMAEQTND